MARSRRPRTERRDAERAARAEYDTRELMKWGGILLIMVGVGLAIYAWQETKVSAGASAAPVDGDLPEIERTGTPPDLHLRIGKHAALYPAAVFEYESTGREGPFLPDQTEINYCLYPIISESHPYYARLEAWKKDENRIDFGGIGAPKIENFAVLVKTERFALVGLIPDDPKWESAVQGLVINRIRGLHADERNLILESFPKADLSRVLILEEGRTPTSSGGSMMLLLLAAVAGVGGVVAIVLKDRVSAATRRAPPPEGAYRPRRAPGPSSRRGRSGRGRRGPPA